MAGTAEYIPFLETLLVRVVIAALLLTGAVKIIAPEVKCVLRLFRGRRKPGRRHLRRKG